MSGTLSASAARLASALGLIRPDGSWRSLDEGAILTARVVNIAAGILTSIVTARALGPVGRGDYFFALAVCGAIAQIAGFGFASSNFYYAAREPNKILRMAGWTALTAFAGCAVLAAAVLFASSFPYFASWRVIFGFPILYPLSVAIMLAATLPICLVGLQRHRTFALTQIASGVLVATLVFLASRFSPTPLAFILAVTISTAFMPAAATLILLRVAPRTAEAETGFFGRWTTFALRAFPSLVLGYLLSRATVFSARASLAPEAFGAFSIAYQIFEALMTVPQSISQVLYPRIAVMDHLDRRHLLVECGRAAGITAVIGTVAVLVIAPLIGLAFGKGFASAAAILVWYIPALVAYAVVSIANQFLAAMRFPLLVNLAWAVSLAVTATGSYLGGTISAPMVAIGTSVGWVIAALLFVLLTLYELPRFAAQQMAKAQ